MSERVVEMIEALQDEMERGGDVFVQMRAAKLAPILAAAREQEQELAAMKELHEKEIADMGAALRETSDSAYKMAETLHTIREQHSAELREARAGMREACAKACIGYGHICNNKGCHAADAAAIGQISDLAADEAIERIKAEAERKGRLEELLPLRMLKTTDEDTFVGSMKWLRERIAALEGKEPSHD